MAANRKKNGMIARGQRGNLLFGLCFSMVLAVLLMLPSGCQDSASTAKAPQTQPAGDKMVEPAQAKTQAQGQGTEPAEVQATVVSPRISFDKVVHDFGEIGPETKHTAQFQFTNTGNAPLVITKVGSCCGVTTKGVKDGQAYAPRESGVLEVDYPAVLYPGAVRKELHVQTNDPEHAVVTLTLKATIVRRVDYKPERLRLFLRQENAGSSDITLTSLDGRSFSITGFRSTANAVSAEFDPAVTATEFVLKPKVDMEKLPRNLRGQISIDLTHPECRNVRVLYDVLPEFTINPPQVMLFNLKANEPVQREIWILSNYQDEFEIESATSQKETVKLLEHKKVGNRYQLRVEVTPPAQEGERAVLADVLEVKIKGGDTLSIPFRGFY
jgi:hypothetical protein